MFSIEVEVHLNATALILLQNKSEAPAAEHNRPRDGMEKHFGEYSSREDQNQFVGPANGA